MYPPRELSTRASSQDIVSLPCTNCIQFFIILKSGTLQILIKQQTYQSNLSDWKWPFWKISKICWIENEPFGKFPKFVGLKMTPLKNFQNWDRWLLYLIFIFDIYMTSLRQPLKRRVVAVLKVAAISLLQHSFFPLQHSSPFSTIFFLQVQSASSVYSSANIQVFF